MKLHISPRAKKQLKKLSKVEQVVVARKIRSLKESQSGSKLSGYTSIYRIRVGKIRVVYRQTKQEIYIILIHHRKDVYRLLKQILK